MRRIVMPNLRALIPFLALSCAVLMSLFTRPAAAQLVLVEAAGFRDHGGWVLDPQFIHVMGSPYLMAHGLGQPVKDATTTVVFPSTGSYKVFVRTKDWVARWQAPGTPGRFQDRKSTRLNSSHANISYAVFCLKKKKTHFYVV